MPAIWYGIVVRWEVTGSGKDKVIEYKETQKVDVYAPEDDLGSEEAKLRIVAKYIGNNDALWKAYGNGLLQVYDVGKQIVTRPRMPPNGVTINQTAPSPTR